MNKLKQRILDISIDQGLGHLGSCLSVVNVIDAIYRVKGDDNFVLSGGHAHLAHRVVMEKHEGREIGEVHDIHCNLEDGCLVSTGSLGQGLPIAVGMALANKKRRVYCSITDGECSEGSIWEALRIAHENKLTNLIISVNVNGWAAYKKVDGVELFDRFKAFGFEVETVYETEIKKMIDFFTTRYIYPTLLFVRSKVEQHPELEGQEAHYKVINEEAR